MSILDSTLLRSRIGVTLHKCWTRFASALLVLISLGFMYGPSFTEYGRNCKDPMSFNDDVRIWIFPFFRYHDPELFQSDYTADYFLTQTPLIHRALYTGGSPYVDPVFISKYLPIGLYILLLITMAAASHRLGGMAAAWATLALTMSSYVFLDNMTGGLARSWAFPIIGTAAALLVYGRIYALALLAVVAAGLYPVVAVLVGISLAIVLLFFPKQDRGQAVSWSPRKTATLILATMIMSLAVLLPLVLSLRDYGERLGQKHEKLYPETGPGGRYGFDDRTPFLDPASALADAFGRTLQGGGKPWFESLRSFVSNGYRFGSPLSVPFAATVALFGVFTIFGFLRLARAKDPAARRLLALPAASVAGYALACIAFPHLFLPQRFSIYPIPVFTCIAIPAAAAGFAQTVQKAPLRRALQPIIVIGVTALCLAFLGGRGGSDTGFTVHLTRDVGLYRYIAALEPDSLIAGWPEGTMDNIPYICRRKVLVTFETHQALSTGYADEMRKRMHGLIDAYFAVDPEPISKLRDEFGVTHLVVDLTHFEMHAPQYFAPFDAWTEQAHANCLKHGSELLRLVSDQAVFREGSLAVLDLGKMGK